MASSPPHSSSALLSPKRESADDAHPFTLDLDPDDPLNLLVHARPRSASKSEADSISMDAGQSYTAWPSAEEIAAQMARHQQQQHQQQQQYEQQQQQHYEGQMQMQGLGHGQQQQQQPSQDQFTFNFKQDDPLAGFPMDMGVDGAGMGLGSLDFASYLQPLFAGGMSNIAVSPSDLHFDFASQQQQPQPQLQQPHLYPNQLLAQQPQSYDIGAPNYPFTFGSDTSLAIHSDPSVSSSGSDASLSPILSARSASVPSPACDSTSPSSPQPQQLNGQPYTAPAHPSMSGVPDGTADLVQQVMRLTGVQQVVPGTGAQARAALPPGMEDIFTVLAEAQSVIKPGYPHPTPPASDTTGSPEPSAFPPSTFHPSAPGILEVDANSASATSSTASAPANAGGSAPAKPTRGKTSHTTIERRYRTNLNARITALKRAVPALRVLERKANGGKGAEAMKVEEEDVVDDRGFVDGVKVARKGSKATVLGKAVEYIRVLKKREYRLSRERAALAALLSSLVGGPALLREFEAKWAALHGSAERDELTEAELVDLRGVSAKSSSGAGGDGGSDDEDGEDDEDDEDEEGRPRKKIAVPTVPVKKEKKEKKPPAPLPLGQDGQPLGKRPRGRPRKNPLPSAAPTPASAVVVPDHSQGQQQIPTGYPPVDMAGFAQFQAQQAPQQQQQQQQPMGTYLLAAFVFLSFFDSPLTSSSRHNSPHPHAHHHEGAVLTSTSPSYIPKIPVLPVPQPLSGWSWADVIPAFHILVSLLVLITVVGSWFSSPNARFRKGLRVLRFGLRPARVLSFLTNPTSAFAVRHHAPTTRLTAGPSAASASSSRASSIALNNSDDQDRTSVAGTPSPPDQAIARARTALLNALHISQRGTPHEAAGLRAALGVQSGVVGLLQSLFKGRRQELEMRGLEQRAWVRLAECVALDSTVPLGTRLQTYWCMSSQVAFFSASISDLVTLALLIHPFSSSKGAALWSRAQNVDAMRPHERLALEVSIDDAVAAVGACSSSHEPKEPIAVEEELEHDVLQKNPPLLGADSPITFLATLALRKRIRAHAEKLFLRTTGSTQSELYDEQRERDETADRLRLVECAESLSLHSSHPSTSSQPALALARLFERTFNPGATPLGKGHAADKREEEEAAAHLLSTSAASGGAEAEYAEISAILRALLLYRRLFASTLLQASSRTVAGQQQPVAMILSPPPSPSPRNKVLQRSLRLVLGSNVFMDRGPLEDAKDQIVDMLTAIPSTR